MLSARPWIGIALLGVSWLLGLDYYETASPWAQAVVLILGAWLLAAGERANPFRVTREAYPELTVAILLLLLPVAWWTPWPYRLPPLAIIAGLVLERVPYGRRLLRPAAAALVTGGVILLAQAVALMLYAAVTARNHDLPGALVKLMAGLCPLAGIDAAADGPMLVVQSMRQSHRLAISWDMVFDPATLMFLVGGLVWITIDTGRLNLIRLRWAQWGWTLARFALIVAAWLPIRAIVLVALYLHRAEVSAWVLPLHLTAMSDLNPPLHVMNQFLSPWVLLVMLVPPILLAWRWVLLLGDAPLPEQGSGIGSKENAKPAADPRPRAPIFRPDAAASLSVKYLAAAACCLFGAILVALGLQWEPIGTRKAGRVMIVERHSPWSPSNHPYNTEVLGGGDDEHGSSYNYAAAYQYLSQYYEMSRLNEDDAIDEKTLSACDVLVIKIPRVRYTPEEVQAVVQFVEAGGGLLLIGDHTNLERSAAHMNDVTRAFGFTFRDDVLYSTQPAPDEEHYQAPMAPHPAIEHVPAFDFAVSCSIDPGISQGRPVVAATGLWSMPGDYHMDNFLFYAQHLPEMRFGSFVQAWSTHGGRGRVIAWGDSTIFSNFCLYQPGKAEVLLNLVEWLNHQGGTGVWWLWTVLGLAAIGNGLWLVRDDGSAWLVIVAATACGWVLGSTATAALLVHEMPLPVPQPDRRLPQVIIDRTTSQVPLAKGAFNEDRVTGRGFGLLEQSIPRLGYRTVRAEGDAVFQGDAVVMICPGFPATEAFRKRLIEYVEGGGRLLVIDAGLNDVPSTANQILRPFGLALDYSAAWNGELVKPALKSEADLAAQLPLEDVVFPRRIQVESAWPISGGTSVAAVHAKLEKLDPKVADAYADRTICAIAQYGKGLVMVASFGNMFNDNHLGSTWWHDPDAVERPRYDLFFALMRRLVKDEPIVVPTRNVGPVEPKINIPLNRPARRGNAQPRRSRT
ncbi:MAG: DUF4350 domain-containing protein [Thermoguttaceae bacterium]